MRVVNFNFSNILQILFSIICYYKTTKNFKTHHPTPTTHNTTNSQIINKQIFVTPTDASRITSTMVANTVT